MVKMKQNPRNNDEEMEAKMEKRNLYTTKGATEIWRGIGSEAKNV